VSETLKSFLSTALTGVCLALSLPTAAGAQTSEDIMGTWQGSFWSTDRSGRTTKEGPYVFEISFGQGAGFEILQGYPKSGITRGAWKLEGNTLTALQTLTGGYYAKYTFTVIGSTMSGTSKTQDFNPLHPQFNYKYELYRAAGKPTAPAGVQTGNAGTGTLFLRAEVSSFLRIDQVPLQIDVVTRGERLVPAGTSMTINVAPGEHIIEAVSPDSTQRWTKKVTVAAGMQAAETIAPAITARFPARIVHSEGENIAGYSRSAGEAEAIENSKRVLTSKCPTSEFVPDPWRNQQIVILWELADYSIERISCDQDALTKWWHCLAVLKGSCEPKDKSRLEPAFGLSSDKPAGGTDITKEEVSAIRPDRTRPAYGHPGGGTSRPWSCRWRPGPSNSKQHRIYDSGLLAGPDHYVSYSRAGRF
jgi:hypothetical protein